jgi:hypothetical protein
MVAAVFSGDGNHNGPRSYASSRSCLAVLEHEEFLDRKPKAVGREQIDFGIRFSVLDIFAG